MKRTVAFKKNATNIFFHILTKCNLKCRHCYINPSQHGHNILSEPEIMRWLEYFSNKNKEANVIFLGGEPTLSKALPFAVHEAGRFGYNSVTIDTNGYLFNNILDEITPDEVDFVSFSLDGASPETNDPIRGEGVFKTCTKGIREASSKGFTTSLIYTVSSKNIHELENMYDLVRDLGISRFFIQVIGIRGSAEKQGGSLQLTKEVWQDIVPAVAEKIAKDHKIIVTYPKVFLRNDEVFECAGLVADNYFLFPNNRVYRCPLCEDFDIHAFEFDGNRLKERPGITEKELFKLDIPEGCVLNKIIQPGNIRYDENNIPEYRIACCMLKEEVSYL
ncbi:MAG: heme biosynthesis protein [Deltaproteobacteria bacterium]|nr:MAG: heme biosynthesis protein [Deltaproteobacteria bacterium]